MDGTARAQAPSISVIITCYNNQATIAEAIRSVLAQSHSPEEVIVVDDGSGDDSLSAIEPFKERVALIAGRNGGPSVARNRGLEAAKSDWVAFLDGDDAWHPDKLAIQLVALEAHPEAVMIATDWSRDPAELSIEEDPRIQRLYASHIAVLNRFQTSTVLVRKELWQAVGGFRSAIDGTEDWDFWMRVSRLTDDLHLAWPLVVYRDEGTSYSKNSRRVYEAMHRMFLELGPPDGPIHLREFRRLVAWHDVRFAYAFWRQGRKEDLQAALQHGRRAASRAILADVALREFLPYLWRRSRRPFGR